MAQVSDVTICASEERSSDVLVHRAGQVQIQLLVQVPVRPGPVSFEFRLEVGNRRQNRRMRRNLRAILNM